jgi:hypothetical protein
MGAVVKLTENTDSPMFQPERLPEWIENVPDEPRWMIPDLIPHDGLVMVSGPRKRGHKTWWGFHLALLLAHKGQPDSPIDGGHHCPVLIVEEEGGRAQTKDRLLMLVKGMDCDAADFHDLHFAHRKRCRLDDPIWVESICKFVEKEHIGLVVLDAVAYMHSGDENRQQDMRRVVDAFREVRSCGTTVMYLHHQGKSGGKDKDPDVDDQSRGSTLLADAYDSHHAMRVKPGIHDIFFTARHRDAEEAKYRLKWDIRSDSYARFTIVRTDEDGKRVNALDLARKRMEPGKSYTRIGFGRQIGLPRQEADSVWLTFQEEGLLGPTEGGWVYCPPLKVVK